MNAGPQLGAWRPRHWVLAIAAVFLAQVGFIFWLGEKHPITAQRPARVPALHLPVSYDTEFLALLDPTLLALPHPQGFSGLAWLNPRPLEPARFDWSEEPRWLTLSLNQVGGAFKAAFPSTGMPAWVTAAFPEPELTLPRIEPVPAPQQVSRVSAYGDLANWRLTDAANLPDWPARSVSATDTELLTNTVVQVLINAEGRTVSATLLSGSGSPAADVFALERVRSARFELLDPSAAARFVPEAGRNAPGATDLDQLQWGRLVFQWRTVPAVSTNAPGGSS